MNSEAFGGKRQLNVAISIRCRERLDAIVEGFQSTRS